jgi:hypothetical protein
MKPGLKIISLNGRKRTKSNRKLLSTTKEFKNKTWSIDVFDL